MSPMAATMAVSLASISLGATALFVRPLSDAGVAPASIAFFRYAITALVLLRTLNLTVEKRSATFWGLAGGAAAGLGWIAYADSIQKVDLATNGIAYMTFPMFSLLAGRVVFGKHPGVRSILSGLLVVVAAGIALGPTAILAISPVLFIAPATFGFSIAVLTERLGVLDPFERLSAVAVGATLTLSPLVLSLPTDQVLPTRLSAWALLIGVAIGCGLVPMWIYGAAAPSIGSARTAAAGAAELPTMFIVGALVFGESIAPAHMLAAAIIFASIALTPTDRSSGVRASTRPLRTSRFSEIRSEWPGTSVKLARTVDPVLTD